ncbi:MAG: sulfotransferase, partial [Acidobacteria bacterium]|nr:sulfotransferase [Acidobacteriota bacterium]
MPRSGSKLLRTLLTRHPGIRIPPVETEFLPFLVQWVRRNGPPENEGSFLRLYLVLRRATYFEFRNPATGPFSWHDWRATCRGRFDVPGLFEGFVRYETATAYGSGTIWGDKSPTYIEHIAWLLREFPSAKVIHIVRDVRDYCVSIRNAWGKDVRRAAQRWRIHVLEA